MIRPRHNRRLIDLFYVIAVCVGIVVGRLTPGPVWLVCLLVGGVMLIWSWLLDLFFDRRAQHDR
jgi:hypothetical protein